MTIEKILFSVIILFGGLLAGVLFKKRKGCDYCQDFSRELLIVLTKVVTPVIVCLSFWVIDVSRHINILTLPLIGFLVSALTIFPARFMASAHKLNRSQTGSYITSAVFSNIGYTLGGFLAFVLLGEAAFGLTVLYCLYFKPFYYTVGFYMAEYYGTETKTNIIESLKKIFTEGVRLLPLLGLLMGVLLNLSGLKRPDFLGFVNQLLIPSSTVAFLFGVGMTLRLSAIGRYKTELFSMSVIKFIVSPVIGLGIAYLMGYGNLMEGLPLKVVFIESVMPVAIASLVLSNLFDLDKDLSNSCWILTTLLVIPLLPLIIWILNLL
ncbi:MAG: hypothetical protein ABH836_06645 [Candidatus Omnitrophota bacterium]